MSDYSSNSNDNEEEEEELSYTTSMVSIIGPNVNDCGYCKGKDTSISFGIWARSMTCPDYQSLIDRGWRRSGKYLYKPDLEKSCCPQYTIRLHANQFDTTKGQKKIINKFNRYVKGTWDPDPKNITTKDDGINTVEQQKKKKPSNYVNTKSLPDILAEAEEIEENKYEFKIELELSSFTKEKFALYAKYQASIHNDKEEDISEKGFTRFLVDSPLKPESSIENPNVQYGSFHQKYMLNGKLIALAVIDILPKCVSSVYFMYDPEFSFLGLGKYSAFREISLVQNLSEKIPGLQYYYLGFYIHSCPKMNYKGQYAPSDLLDPIDYAWYPIDDFKKRFDEAKESFVTFSKLEEERDKSVTAGWTNPNLITDKKLSTVTVFLDVNGGRAIPLSYLLSFEENSHIRKITVDYVCSVGLSIATKMTLCL